MFVCLWDGWMMDGGMCLSMLCVGDGWMGGECVVSGGGVVQRSQVTRIEGHPARAIEVESNTHDESTHPGGEEGEVVAHEALHGLLLRFCKGGWMVWSGEGDNHVLCMYIHIHAP